MPERLALYTTMYPGVERFLPAWFASLNGQTDRDFDLWIGLHELPRSAVEHCVPQSAAPQWLDARAGDTAAGIRSRAAARLADEYDVVVFVDSDDLMHDTRVESARVALRHFDVHGCALRLMSHDGTDLGIDFGPPAGMHAAQILPRYNAYGLSNTAYRSSVLRELLPLPGDCVLVDWQLSSRALSLNCSMSFDRTPHMYYRQHAANTAEHAPPFTCHGVRRASRLVLDHYGFLLNGDWPLPYDLRQRLVAERDRVARFCEAIQGPESLLQRYVGALNGLPPVYVWWWCVALPELEAMWSS